MASIGIVRKLDNLGRITLPIEIRQKLSIRTAIEKGNQDRPDSLEIFVDRDKIILRRYDPACTFCGNAEGIIIFKCKFICFDCIKLLLEDIIR